MRAGTRDRQWEIKHTGGVRVTRCRHSLMLELNEARHAEYVYLCSHGAQGDCELLPESRASGLRVNRTHVRGPCLYVLACGVANHRFEPLRDVIDFFRLHHHGSDPMAQKFESALL